MQYLAERPSRVTGGLLDVPRSVDDLFNRFWGGHVLRAGARDAWQPAVDILETPQAYFIRTEIPGVAPEDVDVTVSGDTITMRGEKMLEEKLEEQAWRLRERVAGQFERSVTLPSSIASDAVEAEARHGVLTVKVMKAKEAQTRKVSVRLA